MTRSHKRIKPEDWTTIWQSELAALAVDQEISEVLVAAVSKWNAEFAQVAGLMEGLIDTDRPPLTDAPSRTSSAVSPFGHVGTSPD